MTILSVNGRIFPDVDAYDYWKEKFKAQPMRDTVTLPPETPIQPIQQAQHALTIQELRGYDAGNGKRWYNATGWCCYTYYGHSLSDELADCLYEAAREQLPGHKIRTDFADCGIELERNNHLADFSNVINTVQKSRAVNSHP